MGCVKSKSPKVKNVDVIKMSVSMESFLHFLPSNIKSLNNSELEDVTYMMHFLRVENLDVFVAACAFNRLFTTHPEVKNMFLYSAFLDPDHTLDCSTDPWFQGFLKAFVNSIIKYIILQRDEKGLRLFIADLTDMHQRVKGVRIKHVQNMMRFLFEEVVNALGTSVGDHHIRSFERLLALLCNSALTFLPLHRKQTLCPKLEVSQPTI